MYWIRDIPVTVIFVLSVMACSDRSRANAIDASKSNNGTARALARSGASAAEVSSWPLPVGEPDAPGMVSSMARCRDDFFLVDRRLAIVYRTNFKGPGRRIGRQGDRPGEFQEPTAVAVDCERAILYVVDVTGISVFDSSTGRFLRRAARPSTFTNRGQTAVLEGDALFTSGLWPRDMNADARDTEPARVHEGARFGLRLDLKTDATSPLFDPVDKGCRTFSSYCWESSFDRVDHRPDVWVFAQMLTNRVAIVDASGHVTRTIEVKSPAFQSDGKVIEPSAPLEIQIGWGERNSSIEEVYAFGDRVAVVHRLQTTRGWKRGTLLQLAVYVNVYRLDGTLLATDVKLPDLPIGKDDKYVYVVDYGPGGRRESGEGARLVAVAPTS